MFNFWTVMYLIFVGVVAGFVARLVVPGRDAIGCWWTVVLGIAGSFAGGFLAWALFGWDEDEGALQPGGVIFSIIGAVLILLGWRSIDRRRSPTPRGSCHALSTGNRASQRDGARSRRACCPSSRPRTPAGAARRPTPTGSSSGEARGAHPIAVLGRAQPESTDRRCRERGSSLVRLGADRVATRHGKTAARFTRSTV